MEQKLTQQEIFDQVANHLLTQIKKSYDPVKKECQYRGPNGLKCAVGGIITDSELGKQSNSINVLGFILPFRLAVDKEFLRDLQVIHDENKPSRWINKLSLFAKKHKLDSDVLKKYRKPKTPKVESVLTEQQIFDKVVLHLLTQKKKATLKRTGFYKSNPVCAYLNDDGLKCAVGALLTDQEAQMFKNTDAPLEDVIKLATRYRVHELFLQELQIIHDESKPSRWYEKLSAMANKKKFDRTVLNGFKKNA